MGGRLARAIALVIVCTPALSRGEPKAKARIDPLLAATAKACGVTPERLAPTQAPTDRAGPADASDHGTTRWYRVGNDAVTLEDDDDDHRPDARAREIATDDDPDRLVCRIDDRWSRGRWHPDTVTRYEGADAIVTTFRRDRAVKTEKRSAIEL
jgi:hypothetical protein